MPDCGSHHVCHLLHLRVGNRRADWLRYLAGSYVNLIFAGRATLLDGKYMDNEDGDIMSEPKKWEWIVNKRSWHFGFSWESNDWGFEGYVSFGPISVSYFRGKKC